MHLVIDTDREQVLDAYDADVPGALDDALAQRSVRIEAGHDEDAVEVHEHPSPGIHPHHIAAIIKAWEAERA